MMSIHSAYILLGGNLGNREENIALACSQIEQIVGQITLKSSIYETAAWGKEDQPDFYNQVLCVETILSPSSLLTHLLKIEDYLGRVRYEKWGERLIDIDILYYDNEVLQEENLTIPHPGIPDRRFVLVPLNEISSDFIHPVLHQSNKALLEKCTDPLEVKKKPLSI